MAVVVLLLRITRSCTPWCAWPSTYLSSRTSQGSVSGADESAVPPGPPPGPPACPPPAWLRSPNSEELPFRRMPACWYVAPSMVTVASIQTLSSLSTYAWMAAS